MTTLSCPNCQRVFKIQTEYDKHIQETCKPIPGMKDVFNKLKLKKKEEEKRKQKIIQKIKKSHNFLTTIDQYLHNNGINRLNRFDLIKYIIHNLENDKNNLLYKKIDHSILSYVYDIIKDTIINKSEIIQRLFMFYGNSNTKKDLDQFYTPLTISQFIKKIVLPNKRYIDPAAGTGDLLIEIDGNITLWDISSEATELSKINYGLFNKKVTSVTKDSLLKFNCKNNYYHYSILNPPFGTKTTTDNPLILDNYVLTNSKKKQELGILFIERSIQLLRNNGVLFVIVPGGYLGNNQNLFLRNYIIENTKILGILKLPDGTFARSGTGVGTNLLILKKEKVVTKDYSIFISEVNDIGYELNKKHTPIKYKKNENDHFVFDEDNNLVIVNDFNHISKQLQQFSFDHSIKELQQNNSNITYESVNIKEIFQNKYLIMDIGRYLKKYKDTISQLQSISHQKIRNLCIFGVDYSFTPSKNKTYKYIDISEVNTPLYNGKTMIGTQLPGRAKNKVKKNDIILSRLRGNISFSIIMEDDIIVTNGMCVLRPKDMNSLLILFANLYQTNFNIQHQSLTTGSILECISDEDILDILIEDTIPIDNFQRIYDSMNSLHKELSAIVAYI